MPLGALFLILQGIAELLRCRYQLDVNGDGGWMNLPLYAIVLCAIFMETFFPNILPLGRWSEVGIKGAFGMSATMIGALMIASCWQLFLLVFQFPLP